MVSSVVSTLRVRWEKDLLDPVHDTKQDKGTASNFSAELGSRLCRGSIAGRTEGSTSWKSMQPVGPMVGEGKLHGIGHEDP